MYTYIHVYISKHALFFTEMFIIFIEKTISKLFFIFILGKLCIYLNKNHLKTFLTFIQILSCRVKKQLIKLNIKFEKQFKFKNLISAKHLFHIFRKVFNYRYDF